MTETQTLEFIKNTEHGQLFVTAVKGVLGTISKRILIEDPDGYCLLSRVGDVLNIYIDFRIREALLAYAELSVELHNFASKIRHKKSRTMSETRTWNAIERIMTFLVIDGKRFLEIAESEMKRLNSM